MAASGAENGSFRWRGSPARPSQTRADPAVVKAQARGFRYERLLDEGRYTSISEMAEAKRLERGYLGSLLRLTLLAPDGRWARHAGDGTGPKQASSNRAAQVGAPSASGRCHRQ